jgi:hypothetical protein
MKQEVARHWKKVMSKIKIDTILDPQQTEELWWLLENFALMFLHGIKVNLVVA